MRRAVLSSLVLVAVLASTRSPSAQQATRRLFLDVTDASGAAITGLTAADFVITQGGTPRKVVRASYNTPQRVLLVVDTSSAMQQLLTDWRAGLTAFIDVIPAPTEIGLVTIGGPLRPRVPPSTDRQKLLATVERLASDNGENTFFDSLLEADRRFLAPKAANNAWPVIVILTTDNGDGRFQPDVVAFNRFVADLVARGANAHALVLRGKTWSTVNDLAENLVGNLGGIFQPIVISTGVPGHMKTIGERVASDFQLMVNRYEVEFQADAKLGLAGVEVHVAREGARLQAAGRRP